MAGAFIHSLDAFGGPRAIGGDAQLGDYMSTFSATDAAFHGFSLIKRDPLTFLGCTLIFVAFGVYMALTMVPAYVEYFSILAKNPNDQAAALEAVGRLFAAVGVLYLLMVPVYMVTLGALTRSVVHGQSQGWFLGLKFGGDELRILLVTIVGYILTMLPYFGGALVGGIVGGVLMAVTGNQAAMFLVVVGVVVGLCMMIWVGVRLSFAGPATIAEGRFVIFDSWAMTKGRFWTLFLAYLLLFVIITVIELVILAVMLLAAGGMIAGADGANGFDASMFENISVGPVVIVTSAAYGAFITIISAAFLGVGARGYLDWKQNQSERVEPTI